MIINYLVWILVTILYAPIFYTLYRFRWDKVDYTHAYFILPISLWFTWRKRAYLKELIQKTKSGNNLLSFFLLVFGILMFIFGWREDYLFISTLSIVPLLYGLISYLYGMNVAKVLSFPILYLLLLVPPPFGILDSITLPMRHGISVVISVALLCILLRGITVCLITFYCGEEAGQGFFHNFSGIVIFIITIF